MPTNTHDQPIGESVDGWSPRARPSTEAIEGHHCRIETLDVDRHGADLSHVFVAGSEDPQWTYLSYGPFDSAEAFLSWLKPAAGSDDPMFHAIVDSRSNQAVGLASYLRIEPEIGSIEVGHIHFSPRLGRTTAATEAMYLMMRRAFDELGYRRYEWKCDALNEKSRRAASRFGFQFEGVFRQHLVYKGRNRDTAWFSILDSEWPRLREAYQSWLAPDNFDEAGEQRQSLRQLLQINAAT
ncbi:MAG: RimJ/RimL family protein N-acetyltransferase [Planctomycetota bacterium]|jgi:RimJ/RimL family protein N-acetyltransferase